MQTDTSRDADVHAFLIADVRGYTSFTQQRGDEVAARLAGRFADVVREVVEDHRGRVVELRGDEALVVFGSPRSAIRGAVALQQRFVEQTIADPSLPLTVGIGLDAGEAVPVEGGYRGGALNVAARLCSLARAGEVLASREIVHLALRVEGVRFTERGEAALKGLDKPVHVVAVRSEDRDDAQAIAPFVPLTAATPSPRRRGRVLAAAVALAVVTALVAVTLVVRNSGGSSKIEPDSIGVLDPDTGEVTAIVGLEARPGSIAASPQAVWVTGPNAKTVMRIDPDERAVVDTIPVGEEPTSLAVGFDAVWVAESGGRSVARISPDTNEVVKRIEVGNGPAGVAVGEGAVWVTNRFDGTVSRIDPDTNEVVQEIPVGFDPRGIAVGFGSVWVGLAGSTVVMRIDPQTNDVMQQIPVGGSPGSLAVGADGVWVVDPLNDTVSQINHESNSVADTIGVGDSPSEVAVVEGTVWVANEADGTLSRIGPEQTSASTTEIRSSPQGLAVADDDLWVSVGGAATSHRGGTLRLVSSDGPFTLDPAVAYDIMAWTVLHTIGDGLVAFKAVGGADGATLVPDLATSLPTPTEAGRRYTFQLRGRIEYSNGEVVVPTDVRRAFERGFAIPSTAGNYAYFFGEIVGARACIEEPETCDLSRGIVADDASGTIAFHLDGPDPEFLYKLALPFAYPVPASVPDEEQREAGLPGTGPYMLEGPMTEEGLTLVRNPRFRPWSAAAQPEGYVDRIEWTFGVKPGVAAEAVAGGRADVAIDGAPPDQLAQYLVNHAGQVHFNPSAATIFVALNTRVSPFDDVDARRALNFALDRAEVIAPLGGDTVATPTCQQLPPNFPGYEPYCPYTSDPGSEGVWISPDLEAAHRLIRRSGTEGMRVTLWWASFGPPVRPIREALEELGYRVRVRSWVGGSGYFEYVSDSGNEVQLALGYWGADYPAASNFITSQLTCDSFVPNDPSNLNVSGFCDPEIDAMIDRATRVQAEDPVAGGALWAEIDRAIVDEAPYLWLHNPIVIQFVSERLGNYQVSQQCGCLLVNQVWVR